MTRISVPQCTEPYSVRHQATALQQMIKAQSLLFITDVFEVQPVTLSAMLFMLFHQSQTGLLVTIESFDVKG